jgi:hypothetical protein
LIYRNGENFPIKILCLYHVWDPNWKLIELDSIKFIGRYQIHPNSCATVYDGNTTKPIFTDYESITITTVDKKLRHVSLIRYLLPL